MTWTQEQHDAARKRCEAGSRAVNSAIMAMEALLTFQVPLDTFNAAIHGSTLRDARESLGDLPAALDEIDRLRALLEDAGRVLEKNQHCDGGFCPSCGGRRGVYPMHTHDCTLAAVLARIGEVK